MKKRELSNNQKIYINLAASFFSYIVSSGISFFLSPYIVRNIGVAAYGFVNLANNFISYASLVTIAVNSLAGRFITIKIKQNDYDGANRYYSSVFIANSFLSSALLVAGMNIVIFLEKLIDVPENILWDVKILFASLFLNCIINTVGSVFGVSIFANNKLYLGSIRGIESNVARAIILVVAFILLPPKVSYLGITSLLTGIYSISFNIYYTKRLSPYLKIRKKYFDFSAIKELITSGIWNLITRLGQILTDGLDLLITNLFINSTAMGVLSLAKTVPGVITGIVGSMASSFSPNFTALYAENRIEELTKSLKQSMKIMGVICNLPIIVLIVCGNRFFELWQPTQDARQLQVLSILTIGCIIFSGGINSIYNIFTVVNKLRANSVAVVIGGFLSALITFIVLKTTSLGVFAVAGVSTIISIIRNLCFTAPYGARCLNLKWYEFYPDIFKPVAFVVISIIPSYFINKLFVNNSWLILIVIAFITSVVSIFFGYFVVFNKEDREFINSIFKSKVLKKGV